MGMYAITDTTLNALADAVRSKTGDTALLTTEEMIADINDIVVYNNDVVDGIIQRTLECLGTDTAEFVADYAFYGNPSLQIVVLPCIRSVGDYAFFDCSNLDHVSCGATKIGAYAFYGCDELIEFKFWENLNEIGYAAFGGCSALETVNLKETSISTILPNTFSDSGLRELWLPKNIFCSLPAVSAFVGCPIGQGGSGGVIYVPLKYRVQYESNAMWSRIINNGTNHIVTY